MRLLVPFAAIPLAVALLVGCSGDEESPAASTSTPTAPVTSEPATSAPVRVADADLSFDCRKAVGFDLAMLGHSWEVVDATQGARDAGERVGTYVDEVDEWTIDVRLSCPPAYASVAEAVRSAANWITLGDPNTYEDAHDALTEAVAEIGVE